MIQKYLKKYIIKSNQTIFQAMKVINNNWHEIVLVVDEKDKVIGVVTDGDVRRGLLSGLNFNTRITQVMTKSFIYVKPDVNRATVLDLMKANLINSIPIVDSKKNLIGIHFLQELIGATPKPNSALIIAGGKGARLKPLTDNCPKPMVKVAGRPILERIILHLLGYGIKTIYISINYLGKTIENYFGNGNSFGCKIKYLKEKRILGTGGPLSLLPNRINHPIIVMNGDLVTQINIDRLLNLHNKRDFLATMCVKPYQIEIPFGVIKTNKNKLLDLKEKPVSQYLINAGIYVINPEILKLIPKNQEYPITTLFELLLKKKKNIGIYITEEDWIDVGRHDELKKAHGIT